MFPLHDDNPTERFPYLTVALIAICVLAFFWQLSLDARGLNVAVLSLGAVPAVLFGQESLPPDIVRVPAWATVITYQFLHGGWMHLIGNMLYLWVFGNNVEDAMGHGRFIVFYLLCGALAMSAHGLPDTQSLAPLIGASGAVSGVLGAYLLLYPHAEVLVVLPIAIQPIRVPAYWVLLFWFVLQIVNSVYGGEQQGGVAWGAHIGGFIAGLILVVPFKRREIRLFAPRDS